MGKTYKKRTTKKRAKRGGLRGGGVIGVGGHGCVFSPALKCAGSNTRKNGYVSKVASNRNIDEEWDNTYIARAINRDSKYFIYPVERCDKAPLNASNKEENCPIKNTGPEILQSLYGGINLYDILVPYEDIPAFFEGFINIFDGISLLHFNQYAHRDIKLENMVGIREPSGAYNLRLIDFGLASRFSDLIGFPVSTNYLYWSYEMRLLDNNYVYNENDVKKFMHEISFRKFPSWLYNNSDGSSKLTEDYVKELKAKIQSSRKNMAQVIIASEVYALGRALYEAWYLSTSYIYTIGGKVVKTEESYPDIPDWISYLVFSLVTDMCHYHPFSRISINDSREILIGIVTFLKQELK